MNKLIKIYLFILIADQCLGQTNEFLPLSRFGIGTLNRSWSPFSQATGHSGLAYISSEEYNSLNPASLGFLRITDVEIGYNFKLKKVTDDKSIVNDRSGTLSYIQIGIPLRNSINEILERREYKHNYAISLGLQPFSSASYSFAILDSTEYGKDVRYLNGSGGLNQFQLGFAYRVNHFSAGINMSYIFGNLKYEQSYYIIDKVPRNNSILTDQYFGSGFNAQLGLLYEQIIDRKENNKNKSRKLSYGLTLGIPSNIRYFSNSFHRSEIDFSTLGKVIDTILYTSDIRSYGQLPLKIILGIAYNHKEKSGIQLDLGFENWSSTKAFADQKGQLVNESYLSLGAWLRPDNSGYGRLFKRSQYRIGVFYDKGYLERNNEKLINYGLTFGLGTGFNFQRQICVVNLGFELGISELPNTLKEEYFKINLGLRLNDNEWFLKRRYN